MISAHDLPTLNATLNGTSATLLIAGFICIKRKKITAHRACMIGASIMSLLFLASYVTYHYTAGMTKFAHEGWVRTLYFAILIPHTMLAIGVVPLVIMTLYRALKGRFDKHRRIARWTLPIWLYVGVTGVIIYFMLYHL